MAFTTETTEEGEPHRIRAMARVMLIAGALFTVPLLAACEDDTAVEEAVEETGEATEDAAEEVEDAAQ